MNNKSKLNFNNFPLFEFKIKSVNSINFQIRLNIICIIKSIIVLIGKIKTSFKCRIRLITNSKKVTETNKILLQCPSYGPLFHFEIKLLICCQWKHKRCIGRVFNITTYLVVVFRIEMQRCIATDDFVLSS